MFDSFFSEFIIANPDGFEVRPAVLNKVFNVFVSEVASCETEDGDSSENFVIEEFNASRKLIAGCVWFDLHR